MDHAGIVKQLSAAYPSSEMTRETAAMYLKHLSDIPVPDLQAAVDDAIRLSKYLPSIAEIRQCHEARTKYTRQAQLYNMRWLVAPESPKLPGPVEPEPVRILREIADLRDADMQLDDGELRIVVSDMDVARKRLAWQVARRLRSAGLKTDVRFVMDAGLQP